MRWCRPRWPNWNQGDQEIVELHLRHEFYGADLADALGVPRNQVHTLTSRARTRFETALGAHVVARSRLGSCPELSWILGDWDGDLTLQPAQAGPPAHRHLRDLRRARAAACEPGSAAQRAAGARPPGEPAARGAQPARGHLCRCGPGAGGDRRAGRAVHPVRLPGAAGPAGVQARGGRVRAGRRGAGRGVRDVRGRGHARGELTASRVAPGQFRAGPVRPVCGRGARGEHAQALDLPVRAQEGPRQARRRGGQRHRVLHAGHRDVREVREAVHAEQPPVLGGTLEVQAHLPADPPRAPPPTTPPPTTPPASPTPTDTTTPGSGSTSGGILGTIIGLL